MKRKLFLLLCALLTMIGVQQVKADTSLLDEATGWEKITTLPGTLSNYYFTFVDHSSDLMLTLSRGKNQGAEYNSLYYKTSGNPLNDKSMLFTLEAKGSNYVITNVEYNGYFLQTEWNNGHLYRTHDNGGGDKTWGEVTFAYIEGGYWTLQNGHYPEVGYLGPWDGAGNFANGKELAANKTDDAVGQFQIYAISKTDAQTYWDAVAAGTDASQENPIDMTSLITNPNARSYTGSAPYGWTSNGQGNVINTGLGYDDFPGIFECTNWNGSWSGTMKQTISVPNGKYILKVALQASSGVTAHLVANDDVSDNLVPIGDSGGNILPDGSETDMGSGHRGFKYLTLETTVTDGSITIGYYASADAEHNWVNADNFTLSYLGEDISMYETPLANAKAAASDVDQDMPMNAGVLAALQSAITTYGSKPFAEYGTVSEITTAITALNTAASNATASIAVYEDINDAIGEYATKAAALDVSGAAAYDDSDVESKYENGTYTTLTEAEIELHADYIAAVKAQRTPGSDMTEVISNPSFEDNNNNELPTGWTVSNEAWETRVKNASGDFAMTNSAGSKLFNTWVGGAGSTISQTLANMPVGLYQLTAVMATDADKTFELKFGDKKGTASSVDKSTGVIVTVNAYLASQGNVEISAKLADDKWYKADNFRLTYLGSGAETNLDFNEGAVTNGITIRTYAKDKAEGDVSGMQDVPGWMIISNGDARAAGVINANSNTKLGGSTVPNDGYDALSNDKLLGILAVWSNTTQYRQWIKIPAGNYKLQIPVYNDYGTGTITNLFGFVEDNGTEHYATATSYTASAWTMQTIDLTLASETLGYISLGYTAANSGDASMPHLFVDRVMICTESATMQVSGTAKMGTFCAPFDVAIPSGVTAYTLSAGASANWVHMTEVTGGTIEAGTPVLVAAPEIGETLTQTFHGNYTEDPKNTGVLRGVYERTDLTAGVDYLLQYQGGVCAFYKVTNTGFRVGKNRCYLHIDGGGSARIALGEEDDPTTAINEVEAIKAEAKTMKDGKYLVKGRIVIVNNGKAFGANGQILK